MSPRRLNSYVWFLALVGLHLAQSAIADEVDVRLAKAKTAHARALDAALKALDAELADHVQQLAQTGDYEIVRAASAERESLKREGVLPASEPTRTFVETYLRSRRSANSEMYRTYREALAELTRNLRLDRAGEIDEEMKVFVESEKSLLAERRVRPEAGEAEEPDRSPDTVRSEVLRERHVRTCSQLAETFVELERAMTAAKTLDTTTRQNVARSVAASRAAEKVQSMEFDLCYRVDDVRSAESDRWTMLVVSMDYRPEIVEHIPMTSFPDKIRVAVPRARADEISPGTYVHLQGTLELKSSTIGMSSEAYRPRALYYKCAADARWYSAYLNVQDLRFVKEVPKYLVAETDTKRE